jgi:predicted metal-dependent hydrolase
MKAPQPSKDVFKEHVREWAGKLNVEIRSLTVRSMTTKWASCTTDGRLTFNTDLLDMDTKTVDYAIVHELLHFSVPNHGKLWKSLMRAHLGDYEIQEQRLKGRTLSGRK